ncbi:MAG TPA: Vms1/Ankzf1 family peptidyl-tRNA hydrolase [Ktedonobacterales bacterium]
MPTTVRDLLRRLTQVESLNVPDGEPGVVPAEETGHERHCVPVLSIYLDWRPQETGGRPGVRWATVVLRDRLREIEKTFFPRGAAYDSIRADAARIERFLDAEATSAAQGLAIFASARHQLFETLEVRVPFANEVSARAEPSLFQLARLLDDQETAVVAVVDIRAARLFVMSRGLLREVRELSEDSKYFSKLRGAHGLNQARFQRHAENLRAQFAQEAATQIERLVDEVRPTQVILVGDQVALPLLRDALSPRVLQLTLEEPVRLDITASVSTVAEEIAPLVQETEADQDRTAVERLLEAVRSGRLGADGLEPVRAALERGQVDTLLLAGDVEFPPETRSKLIELATNTGATVEVVDGSEPLRQLGGVGALLRYDLADAGAAAQASQHADDIPDASPGA